MTTTVNDYTALLSGSYWNGIEVTGSPVIVTYSFPTSLPAYDASIPGFTPATAGTFQAFTAAEQAQAIDALGEWSAASGLVFIQVAAGQGDINFQNVDFNTTNNPSYAGAGGIGFYPFGDWNSFSYPSFSGDLSSVRRCLHEFAVPQRWHGQLCDTAARDRTCHRPQAPHRGCNRFCGTTGPYSPRPGPGVWGRSDEDHHGDRRRLVGRCCASASARQGRGGLPLRASRDGRCCDHLRFWQQRSVELELERYHPDADADGCHDQRHDPRLVGRRHHHRVERQRSAVRACRR